MESVMTYIMEVKDEYPTMTLMYKDEGGSYHVV